MIDRISKNKLSDIFSRLPVGICIINPKHKVILWNQIIEIWTGIKRNQILNKELSLFYPHFKKSIYANQISNVLKGGPTIIFSAQLHKTIFPNINGEREYFHQTTVTSIKLEETEDNFAFFIVQDVTDLNTQIKSYQKIQNELIIAKEDAEKANRAKDEFLAVMSHELRTPLNGILGMAQILLMDDQIINNESLKDTIEIIKTSGEHLQTIIQDILDIAAIEGGKDEYIEDVFSLKTFIKSTVSLIVEDIKNKGNHLDVYITDLQIKSDKSKLRQIILNLLSNANKFTENGNIELRVNMINDEIEFIVSDTGIGISADKIKKIFDPFYQVESAVKRNYGGVGLGLSLCKSLVNIIDGRIWVESELHVGSKFHFTIKNKSIIDLDEEEDDDDNSEIAFSLNNKTILYVEDEKVSVAVVSKIFKKTRTKMILANNGLEALEILEKKYNDIDLILMDIQMPIMDGYETTRKIRSNDKYDHIPIIAMTAFTREDDKNLCFKAGCDEYLSKPIDVSELLRKIDILIKLNQT